MQDLARWQTLAWALVAAVVVFVGVRQLGARDDGGGGAAVAVEGPTGGSDPGARGGSRDRAPAAAGLYVHVAGEVRRPGLYRVPPAARVAVAVRRAGGFARRADPTAVNLAARLQDGQQVVVPARGAAAAGGGSASASTGGPAAGRKLSLATASTEQLDGLDGIGPALAKRIVDYRTAHGGFRSLEELQEVGGIGPKRFETLKDGLGP